MNLLYLYLSVINNLIIQWGFCNNVTSTNIAFPVVFNSVWVVVATRNTGATTSNDNCIYVRNKQINGFNLYYTYTTSYTWGSWVTIGT